MMKGMSIGGTATGNSDVKDVNEQEAGDGIETFSADSDDEPDDEFDREGLQDKYEAATQKCARLDRRRCELR